VTKTNSEAADDHAANGQAADADVLARLVRELFEQAVGHDEFSDDDSFFYIGGDSLSGLRVIRQLAETVGEHVAMRALFDHPTVGTLSAYAAEFAAHDKAARS
jgi:hypothetical protein